MTQACPRLLLSAGEPAGIGPDLCVLAAQEAYDFDLTVIADPALLLDRAERLNLQVELIEADADGAPEPHRPGRLKVLPIEGATGAQCGELDVRHASYVLETITEATLACRTGRYDALVTGPVHKGIINDAGIPFSGHTEYIAELTGGHPVMMLTAGSFRVALATTHLPLQAISAAITGELIETVVSVLDRDLRSRFGIDRPRILVTGLNPHAGEGGHLGREEIDTIEPALARLRAAGIETIGPVPADTAFVPGKLAQIDAVLAMYHDQGLPVLKHAGFGRAVNITLGLPIIRTSVDHGTALELAGTGRIDRGSLSEALSTAADMVRHSRAGAGR